MESVFPAGASEAHRTMSSTWVLSSLIKAVPGISGSDISGPFSSVLLSLGVKRDNGLSLLVSLRGWPLLQYLLVSLTDVSAPRPWETQSLCRCPLWSLPPSQAPAVVLRAFPVVGLWKVWVSEKHLFFQRQGSHRNLRSTGASSIFFRKTADSRRFR